MNKYLLKVAEAEALVEKVNAVANLVHSLQEAMGDSVPRDVAQSIQNVSQGILSFQSAINEEVDIDSLVSEADRVGIYGLTTAIAMNNFTLASERGISDRGALSEVSQDLRDYCAAHLVKPVRLETETGLPRFVKIPPSDEQKIARLSAQIETMEREFLAMEARLTAMGESADKAVLRVEELTMQQADAMRTALTREVGNITEEFTSTHETLKGRLSEFDTYSDQAKKLLGQYASQALAGGHMLGAQREEKQADQFRALAIGLMGVTVGVVGLTIFQASKQTILLDAILLRVVFSLALVLPTAYLARESAKHRAQAVDLRRTSLDFAALEPFLKGIEGEEGLKVRAELARRAFFSSNSVDSSSSYGLDPQAIIIKGMDTIADLAKKKS